MVIQETQDAVFMKIDQRIRAKGALQFFSAETGLGKTTGAQLAMVKLWAERWDQIPFLVMVPTRKDADLYWQAMEKLEEGCSAVWTQAHDPSDSTIADFHISCQFTKEQAKKYRCLIITHNAGKAAEDWVGRRDAVLIDEYPQPVASGIVHPWQFIRARDEELSEPFRKAATWAEEQASGKGLEPVGVPDWVPLVLGASPTGEAGQCIQQLAQHMQAGTAFQRSWQRVNWTWYNYDLPFEEKAIVFSATAHLEGWHFDPLSGGKIERGDFRVDYKNMTARYIPWPKAISRYHRKIIADYSQREEFIDYLVSQIGHSDAKTLIVCPKDLESDVERKFPDARVTHWGCDVGSNEYRDCEKVWLVSLFHQPKDVLYAKYLGHSKVNVSDETLKAGQNFQGSTFKLLENEHHAMQIKQMGARGKCRFVNDAGIAEPQELNCLFYDEDIFSTVIPAQFPGATLVFPVGTEPMKRHSNKPVVSKLIRYLNESEAAFAGAPELLEAGIKIKGSDRKKKIIAAEELFDGIGWKYEAGQVGRYGQPSGFRRI